MSRSHVRDIAWDSPVDSDKFGLLRMEELQDRTMDFDPMLINDHMIIVDICRDQNLSQRGAIVEWARTIRKSNPKF